MLNKGQETNRPSPPKINMFIIHLWWGWGGVVEDMLNNFSQQFLRSIKTKCKKNETKQILDLAHLIGKASTDAISKQVRLYWLDLLC